MEGSGKDKMEKGTTKPIEENIMLADFIVDPPQSAFTGLHYDVQEIIAANAKVVWIRRVSGKHVISYEEVYVHRIIDRKRLQNTARRDDLSFMMQLGLLGSASLQPTAMLGHKIL